MSQSRRGFFRALAGVALAPIAVTAAAPPTSAGWAEDAAARSRAFKRAVIDAYVPEKLVWFSIDPILPEQSDAVAYFTKLETEIVWHRPFCPALSEAG